MGGVKDGGMLFCRDTCRDRNPIVQLARQIPSELVHNTALTIHQGSCPKCQGRGPVDLHTSHRVWSIFVLTSWSSRPLLCCRSCGVKEKFGDLFFSAVLGWWGFPFGLIITPVQIGRNLVGLIKGPNPLAPSKALEEFAQAGLAADAYHRSLTTGQAGV